MFAKRWFSDDVIVVSVSWYLRFKLSYRDLAQIMSQQIDVILKTINRATPQGSRDYALLVTMFNTGGRVQGSHKSATSSAKSLPQTRLLMHHADHGMKTIRNRITAVQNRLV